jgi:hypothetical protein
MSDREDNTARVAGPEYHYALEEKNRATVRAQGTRINQSLKRIKKLASNPEIPVIRLLRDVPDDEITQQHVTLPSPQAADRVLKTAIDAVEERTRQSLAPKKTSKRWFGWGE